jgi:hypothetical protein
MPAIAQDLIVLMTSPAGLGHIRVMEALRQGLPGEVPVRILGVNDVRMQALHRVTSINPYLRQVMEAVQHNPIAEGGFTRWYRKVLRQNPQVLKLELVQLLQNEACKPNRVILVATHFGSAYQVAAIKADLETTLGMTVLLAVIVTDDSPQQLWAVAGADMIFVPSETTRASLERLLIQMQLPLPQLVVAPYPVSPFLRKRLSAANWGKRLRQVSPDMQEPLTLMIPISGAAVHLDYYRQLIVMLSQLMPFYGIVVSRESAGTKQFLAWCKQFNQLQLYVSRDDHEVVQLYEQAYKNHVIGVEVSKPSEQLFKVLFTPKQRGGAIMLLAEPVGRQEEDNMLFLNRHHLMPGLRHRMALSRLPNLTKEEREEVMIQASNWRGMPIPHEGAVAAGFIYSLYQQGILKQMMHFSGYMKGHHELSDDGVRQVWKKLLGS